MRALFVIGSLDAGGAEGQLTQLLEQVHGREVEAAVATFQAGSGHTGRVDAIGVRRFDLSPGSGPRPLQVARSARSLVAAIRSFRPDVVYAWLEEASLVAAPVARAMRVPLLVTRTSTIGSALERSRAMRTAIWRAERLAAVVTAVSPAVLDDAVRRGIAPGRLRLVPNGEPAAPALPEPPSPPVRLGYLANFRPEKGHLRFLRALAAMETETEWRAEMAGFGPTLDEVRAQAARLGLEDRVSLPGAVDDPREFWARSHVGVLLSDEEGFGMSLLEAAIAGRPLVGTDVGGIPFVIGPEGGTVVPLDPIDATAAALAAMVDSPGLRERSGGAARKRALEEFSIERFAAGHLAALREAATTR